MRRPRNGRIQQLLKEMEAVVQDDALGELPFGWRLRLSCEMNETFGKDEGTFRTNCLAYFVAGELARFLLPGAFDATVADECHGAGWAAWFLSLPRNALDAVRAYLGNYVSIEYLCELTRVLGYERDHITAFSLFPECMESVRAVYCLCRHVAGWETGFYEEKGWYEECRDDDKVADLRDDLFFQWGGDGLEPHLYAAWVASNPKSEYDRQDPRFVERSREFWLRWVRERVPEVLGPVRTLRKRLK